MTVLAQQHTHMIDMVQFATVPGALAYVNIGEVGTTSFFILTEYPLWKEDREYTVRTDLTFEEAKADRKVTTARFEAAQAAAETLAQY